ncbi:MAG: hypothetical protein EOS21_32675 [Mesorhizobium sp.]|nr:MAG: hypothetical protein EOS21_32675 [Mesorhizobium sp.]
MPSHRRQQGWILPALAAVGAAAGRNCLRDVIQRLALANRHYGYRRIGALLGREGWQVNHKRVLRVMGEDNLLCLRTRPFVPRTTDSRHSWRVVPNLARGMELTGVNQLWVGDITYLHLAQSAYLAVVARCIQSQGHRMGARTPLAGQPCCRCPKMAISARVPVPGSLISDRGVQYACTSYSDILHGHGIQPSMSRVGNPYDNAHGRGRPGCHAGLYRRATTTRHLSGCCLAVPVVRRKT